MPDHPTLTHYHKVVLLRRLGWDLLNREKDPDEWVWSPSRRTDPRTAALGRLPMDEVLMAECCRLVADRGWSVLSTESGIDRILCLSPEAIRILGEAPPDRWPPRGARYLTEAVKSEGILELD